MKKIYMTPIVKMENAQPTSLLCESFNSNVGIDGGNNGSNGDAHAKEDDWDIWGAE